MIIQPGEYTPVRPMLVHQEKAFAASVNSPAYGLFFEQRCGKSKVIFDTVFANYRTGPFHIDAFLNIAWPSGVHRVWGTDELPKDQPETIPVECVIWQSGKMEQRKNREALERLLTFTGLSFLSVNCEATLTDVFWKYLAHFLRARRVLVNADESSWAASPNSARTKRLLAISRHPHVLMKRITDGTPCAESPLDLWAPLAFLDPKILQCPTFFSFKARYAVQEEGYAAGGRTFKKVVGYRNLEDLQARIAPFSHRVLRAEVSDAPPKVYQRRLFALSPAQRRVYDSLRDEYRAELSYGEVTVAHVLTRLLRLSMISRGYFPPERVGVVCGQCEGEGCDRCENIGVVVEDTPLVRIDHEHTPALDALSEEMRLTRGPLVVWTRFHQDTTDVLGVIQTTGRSVGRYDGTVPMAKREQDYLDFKDGKLDALVGTSSSGLTRGHDLSRAETMVCYSDGYSLRNRLQWEDRAETLTRRISTGIVDLVAEDTVDEQRVAIQRAKRTLSDMVLRDPPSSWL